METLMRDLRFAFRQLRRSPGFTAVAVATVALGIGANTTVFSMVNAVLLRPLPFEASDRLVSVESTHPARPGDGLNLSYPDYLDIREQVGAFRDVAIWDWRPFNLRGRGDAIFVGGAQITASFFPTLGVEPIRGRVFTPEEDRAGGPRVLLLSEGLWRSEFAADPAIVGKTVNLDGTAHTVIGVMPAGIGFPERVRLWVPLRLTAERSPRGNRWLGGVARLAPGATVESADAELSAVAARLEEAYPATNTDRGLRARDLREELLGEGLAPLFLLLLGAVGVLLLIVCANLANLLLARGARRDRELAVRGALGASRGRLVRQLLTESVLLGGVGAGLGWLLGQGGVDLVVRAVPTEIPAWIHLEPDLRILAFVTAVTLLAVLLFGLVPAVLTARRDLNAALREASGRAGGPGRGRLRSGLVVAEVALSLTLLVGAGLVLRSLLGLAAVDPGIEEEGRLMATTSLPAAVYSSDSARVRFHRELLAEVERAPGVRSAGIVSRPPLRGSSNAFGFTVEGQGEAEHRDNSFVLTNSVSPGYFRAAGLALLRGRSFGPRDDADALPVGIVNRELAERYWPEGEALGERLKYGPPDGGGEWIRIVGVVEDVRHMGLDREPTIQLYRPYPQQPTGRLSVVVHAATEPDALRPALTAALGAVDPDQAFYDMMTLRKVVDEAAWEWKFFSGLFWTFGALAALLAALGMYGVLSYGVASRQREFGVRLAMGAEPGDVMRRVMGGAARLFAVGALLGLAAGAVLNRAMASVLYEVAALDLPTFGAVLLLLAAVAAVATWIPARSATRADPVATLRAE